MNAKYTVGQKLWWVPAHSQYDRHGRNGGYEVTVTKVGIKYVTVSWVFEESNWPLERTFNKAGGYEKGDLGHHRCGRAWPTRESYDEHIGITAAWRSLCELAAQKLQRHASPPANMTIEDLSALKATIESLT